MALRECPDCLRKISTTAPTCPGCGRVMEVRNPEPSPPVEGTRSLGTCRGCNAPVAREAGTCPQCGTEKLGIHNQWARIGCLGWTVIGVAGLLFIGWLGSVGTGGTSGTVGTVAPNPPPPPPKPTPADSAALRQRHSELSRKFRFDPDEVQGGGWYRHVNDGSVLRTGLRVPVKHDGFTYLMARYYGDDWLFFDHLIVRIGEQVLRTTPQPTYSENLERDNSGGSVWETLHLIGGIDNGIYSAIANASERDTVRVRFEGDQYYRDIRLTRADINRIKESREFGELLARHPWLRPTR